MQQHPLGKMVPCGYDGGDGDVNDCDYDDGGSAGGDDDEGGGGDDFIIDIVAPVHFCKQGSGYN